jgi:hypothetical protein
MTISRSSTRKVASQISFWSTTLHYTFYMYGVGFHVYCIPKRVNFSRTVASINIGSYCLLQFKFAAFSHHFISILEFKHKFRKIQSKHSTSDNHKEKAGDKLLCV